MMHHHEPFPLDAQLEHPVLIAMQNRIFASALFDSNRQAQRLDAAMSTQLLASFSASFNWWVDLDRHLFDVIVGMQDLHPARIEPFICYLAFLIYKSSQLDQKTFGQTKEIVNVVSRDPTRTMSRGLWRETMRAAGQCRLGRPIPFPVRDGGRLAVQLGKHVHSHSTKTVTAGSSQSYSRYRIGDKSVYHSNFAKVARASTATVYQRAGTGESADEREVKFNEAEAKGEVDSKGSRYT